MKIEEWHALERLRDPPRRGACTMISREGSAAAAYARSPDQRPADCRADGTAAPGSRREEASQQRQRVPRLSRPFTRSYRLRHSAVAAGRGFSTTRDRACMRGGEKVSVCGAPEELATPGASQVARLACRSTPDAADIRGEMAFTAAQRGAVALRRSAGIQHARSRPSAERRGKRSPSSRESSVSPQTELNICAAPRR